MIRVDHLPLDFDPSHVSSCRTFDATLSPTCSRIRSARSATVGWVQPVERKRFDRRRILNLIDMAMAMLQPIQ